LLAIWRRSIRKVLADRDGKPGVKIMQPDKEHLHHRLLDYGLKQHHVALVLYAVNMLIVGLGLFFIIAQEAASGLFLLIFITAVYLLVKYVLQIELWETTRLLARSNDKPQLTRFKLIFYPLFDLLWMSLSAWLAGVIALSGEQPFHGMSDWAFRLPIWVMPVLLALFVSKAYIKIWRNSFFRDYLSLMLAVVVGCSISWALICLLTNNANISAFNQLLLFCLFSLIGVIGIRTLHQVVREWCAAAHNHNKRNVLVYGAGTHGGLYMRERHLNHSVELGSVNVVGFIDDNSSLREKYVYGKAVLGELNDFNDLVSKHNIDEVILTTSISTDNLSKLKQFADQHKIKLMEWRAYTVGVH
jgi:UDP-GlcNAc:undecaprenyl-phosphate GlcNAc-1-phosphate transferase